LPKYYSIVIVAPKELDWWEAEQVLDIIKDQFPNLEPIRMEEVTEDEEKEAR